MLPVLNLILLVSTAGGVLSVETLKLKYCQWSAVPDPDRCFWQEHAYLRVPYLHVYRLFYLTGSNTPLQIGEAAKIPGVVLKGSVGLSWSCRGWYKQDVKQNATCTTSFAFGTQFTKCIHG